MLVATRVLASVEPGACERSLVVVAEVGDRGTADTGLSRCLARNGVGEDRVKEGDRVRGGLVELNGGSVEGLGTAGTAPRRREEEGRDGEGTAGTGCSRREENLGWSACWLCCLKTASSSRALSSRKL